MDRDFAREINHFIRYNESDNQQEIQTALIDYLSKHKDLIKSGKILDVGERNPAGTRLENVFNVLLDNTKGDLDEDFFIPIKKYDLIIMSHVIEHLFNPLSCLMKLKNRLSQDGRIIVFTPWASKSLKINWSDIHYHEIDEYRMKKLIKRCGLIVEDMAYYPRTRGGFWGIRPLIKKIISKNVLYLLREKT